MVVTPDSGATFSLTTSNWYHLGSVTIDGVNVAAPASYTFTNVQADHSIVGNYVADLAANNTPKWWLYQMNTNWSTNFDAAALGDQDGDGVPTWEEYVAGTDPLNASSALVLGIARTNGQEIVTLPTVATTAQYGSQRYYSLECATNLSSPPSGLAFRAGRASRPRANRSSIPIPNPPPHSICGRGCGFSDD